MNRAFLSPALALLLGAALVPAVRADFEIRVPFVHVRVGQPTIIRAPFVHLVLPGRSCLPRMTPRTAPQSTVILPGDPPPVPTEAVPDRVVPPVQTTLTRAAAPPAKAPATAMTLQEFASSFKPSEAGGKYEVVLKHPTTGKPVTVSFNLPPGTPKKITAGRLRLEIRYPKGRPVVVRFFRNGNVQVRRG
jgi:hypothetical protein